MQLWEIIVLISGIAFVALVIFAINAIKKLSSTVEKIDQLVSDNTEAINSILKNADGIARDTKDIVGKVDNVVGGASKLASKFNGENGVDSFSSAKKLYEVFGIAFTGYKIIKGYFDRRKLKKMIKETKKLKK